MKTKTLVSLILAFAAVVQADTYTSEWSAFDSGLGQSQSGAVTHAGVFGGWSSEPSHSMDYTIQPGHPPMPPAEPTPGAPVLTIALIGNDVRVAWPASATGFKLEEKAALNSGSWTAVPGPYQDSGGERFILVPATQTSRFYRLMAP